MSTVDPLDFETFKARLLVEREMEYGRWCDEIPYIRFPVAWNVQVIPPFGGAVVRFHVRNKRGMTVSVYLDCYDTLGCYGAPYWEIFPGDGNDVSRYAMEDVAGLIKGISRALRGRST